MGGINLKNIFGEDALSVFVMPPSVEELRKAGKAGHGLAGED
jgi:guanylate kinase